MVFFVKKEYDGPIGAGGALRLGQERKRDWCWRRRPYLGLAAADGSRPSPASIRLPSGAMRRRRPRSGAAAAGTCGSELRRVLLLQRAADFFRGGWASGGSLRCGTACGPPEASLRFSVCAGWPASSTGGWCARTWIEPPAGSRSSGARRCRLRERLSAGGPWRQSRWGFL